VLDEYYALYLNVFRQSEIHFDLLSAEFFRELLQNAKAGGIVFEYRHGGRLVGYNLCFLTADMLIDKYVGFRYPEARELNLYFVNWFHNLAYALERGVKHFVAGWTDPEIKAYLGARFAFTRHTVHVRTGLLRMLLRRLIGYFERDRAWGESHPDGIPGRS
jgi:predicted N-acyltransferase